MLTRRAKAYCSSCLQIVSLSPAIASQIILGVCALQGKIAKSNKNPLIRPKSSLLVLVVIDNMPMPICNRFHERLANNGKITTFAGARLFDALIRRFP